ncbi:response regulator [Patescibacteria group bacterium]|nr:response regulator [Patescibacteria group bacterium]
MYTIKNVIIIEDDTPLTNALREKLEGAGLQVTIAQDGVTAITKVHEVNPDVVILDIVLPQVDGKEVLKNIRNHEDTKDLPVFVLTNVADTESICEVSEDGKTSYFLKVNTPLEEIVKRVQALLQVAPSKN